MSDVYRAPDFNFAQEPGGSSGLLENGVAGNYSFAVFDLVDETWTRLKGNKGALWLAWILSIAVAIGASMVFGVIFALMGASGGLTSLLRPGVTHVPAWGVVMSVLQNVLQMLITLPVEVGIMLFCLKRLVKLPTDVGELFQHYGKALTLLLTMLLYYLLVGIGCMLLVIPGIYLLVAYTFASYLVVEKNLGPWEALEASRKAVTHHWWKFFGVFFVQFLIMLLAALPILISIAISIRGDLGTRILTILVGFVLTMIATVWVLPFAVMLRAVLYHKVFGCEAEQALIQAAAPADS